MKAKNLLDGWIEVFKAGKHIDSGGQMHEFTKEDVKQLAETFNPAKYRVPVVVGHPKTDSPAFGWVEEVKEKNGSLLVRLGNIVDEFQEAVNKGLYRERSVALYTPDSPYNPEKGKWALKHLGFLGAAAPAVKGLAPLGVGFADDAKSLEFKFAEADWKIVTIGGIFRRLREWLIEKFGQETADAVVEDWEIESLRQPPEPEIIDNTDNEEFSEKIKEGIKMSEKEEFEKLKEELKKKEQIIAEQEEKIKAFSEAEMERKANEKKQKILNFAESLIKAGKMLPKFKDDFVALASELDAEKEINFSEGKKSALDGLFGFFEQIPEGAVVDVSGKDKYTKTRVKETVDFSEDNKAELDKKIRAYAKEHNITYVEALEVVLNQNKEESYV